MIISNCTRAAATCLSLALSATPSVAGEIFEVNGAAISGYDPVSYFSSGGPIKGSPDINADYKGATFHFATVKNRTVFTADPQKYVPQYGGYCAYGTARGYKAPTEPHAFTLVGGKLYLNYDAAIQESWRQDKAGYISKADQNWPAVKDQ